MSCPCIAAVTPSFAASPISAGSGAMPPVIATVPSAVSVRRRRPASVASSFSAVWPGNVRAGGRGEWGQVGQVERSYRRASPAGLRRAFGGNQRVIDRESRGPVGRVQLDRRIHDQRRGGEQIGPGPGTRMSSASACRLDRSGIALHLRGEPLDRGPRGAQRVDLEGAVGFRLGEGALHPRVQRDGLPGEVRPRLIAGALAVTVRSAAYAPDRACRSRVRAAAPHRRRAWSRPRRAGRPARRRRRAPPDQAGPRRRRSSPCAGSSAVSRICKAAGVIRPFRSYVPGPSSRRTASATSPCSSDSRCAEPSAASEAGVPATGAADIQPSDMQMHQRDRDWQAGRGAGTRFGWAWS